MTEATSPARQHLAAALTARDGAAAALDRAAAARRLADDQVEAARSALQAAEADGRDRRDTLVESIKRAASLNSPKPVTAPKEGAAITQRMAALETAEAARDVLDREHSAAQAALKAAALAVDLATADVLREEFDRQFAECLDAIELLERRHHSMNALVMGAATVDVGGLGVLAIPLTFDQRRLLSWALPPAPMRSPADRQAHVARWREYRAALLVEPTAPVPVDLAE